MPEQPFDLHRARLDPTAVFDSPSDVVNDPRPSLVEKAELLRRWKHDAISLQIASDENMPPGDDRLEEVLDALRALESQQRARSATESEPGRDTTTDGGAFETFDP